MPDTEYATIEDDAEDTPADERCIWPGCTRRRAPGRPTGSGRQPEYCLKADRPETGGGPVHNARNRWAWQRREATGEPAGSVGPAEAEAGEPGGDWPVSTAKQRAGDLLEQARRQHAAALAAFTAERDLYARVAEEFRVMADPASRDLEITAISLKAGRDISAAGEEVARAQRAQLSAERERDDAVARSVAADAAAEQFAEDTEAAERATAQAERLLTDRTAEFEEGRAELQGRARDAEARAEAAAARAITAETAANQAVADAQARAEAAIADAREQTARARDEAALARDEAARVRDEAAAQVRTAREETRDARGQADATAAEARREVTAAREAAEQARVVADGVRRDAESIRRAAGTARDEAQAQLLAARTAAATADARAAAVGEEIARLRDELSRLRDERAAEVTRLEAAHHRALEAERARADRAEAEVDALRQA
ncbi:MAG TPA: hypothetical protein VK817_02320 [Trebonia sp.]|nr:hypothetical protein [Trebonia sp.]